MAVTRYRERQDTHASNMKSGLAAIKQIKKIPQISELISCNALVQDIKHVSLLICLKSKHTINIRLRGYATKNDK